MTMDYLIPADVIAAAAEAMDNEAIRCLGRDLGTVHRDDIAAAALGAALAAGLVAAPAAQPIITWHPSDGPTEEITPGDLCLIGGKEGTFRVASPAAPADDEATVKRMQRAIHDELCECAGGVSPCPHSSADLNAAARAALAALREGQQ